MYTWADEKAVKLLRVSRIMKPMLLTYNKSIYNFLCIFPHNQMTYIVLFFPCLVICVCLYYWRILFLILLGVFYSNELCHIALSGIPKLLVFFFSKWKYGLLFYMQNDYTYPQNTHINLKLYACVAKGNFYSSMCWLLCT